MTVSGVLRHPESHNKKTRGCFRGWGRKPKHIRCDAYESFSSSEEVVSNRWRSPLHHACIGHQLESVRFLVRFGANVNSQDHDGDTPLLAVLKEAVRSESPQVEPASPTRRLTVFCPQQLQSLKNEASGTRERIQTQLARYTR